MGAEKQTTQPGVEAQMATKPQVIRDTYKASSPSMCLPCPHEAAP